MRREGGQRHCHAWEGGVIGCVSEQARGHRGRAVVLVGDKWPAGLDGTRATARRATVYIGPHPVMACGGAPRASSRDRESVSWATQEQQHGRGE